MFTSLTPFFDQEVIEELINFPIATSSGYPMIAEGRWTIRRFSQAFMVSKHATDLSVNIRNLKPRTFSCVNMSNRWAEFA